MRAGNRARPEITVWSGIVVRFFRKYTGKALADFRCERTPEFFDSSFDTNAMYGWPLNRRPLNQGCDRVQVVGQRFESKTNGLKWYAAATSCRVSNGSSVHRVLGQPNLVLIVRSVAKRTRIPVGTCA